MAWFKGLAKDRQSATGTGQNRGLANLSGERIQKPPAAKAQPPSYIG